MRLFIQPLQAEFCELWPVSDSREEKFACTEMGRSTLCHPTPKVILRSLCDKRGGMFILSLPRREGERHDKETDVLLTGADRGCGGVDGLRGGAVGGLGEGTGHLSGRKRQNSLRRLRRNQFRDLHHQSQRERQEVGA
jgi:hypothetical protein